MFVIPDSLSAANTLKTMGWVTRDKYHELLIEVGMFADHDSPLSKYEVPFRLLPIDCCITFSNRARSVDTGRCLWSVTQLAFNESSFSILAYGDACQMPNYPTVPLAYSQLIPRKAHRVHNPSGACLRTLEI